ncbi:MAG: histidine kinase [Rikenellaceae bacterium]|jgi:signal transduction histidine kinase|nr:histidine kinase [Rikenellaceae bacterium]
MVLKILLIVTIVLQLVTAALAIRLVWITKYNSAWMLVTAGLTAMAVARMMEFARMMGWDFNLSREATAWTGVMISLCFAIGVLLIRQILTHITMTENKRRVYERRILDAVIRTEEKERQHFSKELHDGLGPLLSSAKMSVSALDRMNTDPRQKELIQNTYLVIDEAVRSLRELSNNMNPNVLTNFGLVRAVNSFTNKLAAFSPIKVNFSTNLQETRFDSDVEIILYRVICELINNTLKHAKAQTISLSILRVADDEISIIFEDDGIGFIPEQVLNNPEGGMGMSNIASRITSLKGEIDIDSAPGRGTHIRIRAKTTTDD